MPELPPLFRAIWTTGMSQPAVVYMELFDPEVTVLEYRLVNRSGELHRFHRLPDDEFRNGRGINNTFRLTDEDMALLEAANG